MNERIVAILEELRDLSELMGEHFREKAYRIAAETIQGLPTDLTPEAADALTTKAGKLPGIGPGIAAKIQEFISTGAVAELEKLRADPQVVAYKSLTGIAGVGPATAKRWIGEGIQDVNSARRAVEAGTLTVNHMQQLGLEHYDDLRQRIPRAEVTAIGAAIKAHVIGADPNAIFEIAGSYRRGAESSGDIDILITNARVFDDDLLHKIAELLRADRAFIGELSAGSERLTFLYRWNGIVRQVDLLNITYRSYYAALIYFTGSWEFNQRMRTLAKKKGFRLNQAGLFRINDRTHTPIPASSERDIFDLLGMPYIEPKERTI